MQKGSLLFSLSYSSQAVVGNIATPQDDLVTNIFDPSIKATAVRIFPTDFAGLPAMRLELLGCRA